MSSPISGNSATIRFEEFRGNYTSFQELRAERDAQLQAAAATGRRKRWRASRTFVDRFRYQANKASQVQSRIKQLEKVKLIEIQRDPKRVKFKFPLPGSERPASPGTRRAWPRRYGEKVVYRSTRFFGRTGPTDRAGR